jgi:tetraacyldisaccharide 4'-kinase
MRIVDRSGAGMKVFRGEGPWAALLPLRYLLAGLYRLFLALRPVCAIEYRAEHAAREAAGPAPAPRKPAPLVISVGNLEAGGGGKTPCAILVAETVKARGGVPVVLSRGYRGEASRLDTPFALPGEPTPADSPVTGTMTYGEFLAKLSAEPGRAGLRALAGAVGDEPVLYHARGIPVVIDRDRARAAAWALERFNPTHVILDDAYHIFSLRKHLDILLLDWERPFGNGHLLPLGTLREPPAAAARAGAVVFTRAKEARVPREAESIAAGKEIFFGEHEAVDLVRRKGEALALSYLEGREVAIFSGIARPDSFERTVASLGARPTAAYRFADHHAYRPNDLAAMLAAGGPRTLYVTTEKDWVKASDLFPDGAEVVALRISMRVSPMERLTELLFHASDTHLD